MERQVRDDGTHFEQSSYYHVYALDMFMFHHILAETTPEYVDEASRNGDVPRRAHGADADAAARG